MSNPSASQAAKAPYRARLIDLPWRISRNPKKKRFRFYTSEEVKKYLKKHGIPKSRREMKALVEVVYPNSENETVESIGHMHFDVHPQQINIRDRMNEKLIISLEK